MIETDGPQKRASAIVGETVRFVIGFILRSHEVHDWKVESISEPALPMPSYKPSESGKEKLTPPRNW
jgi:hypothetical protein